MYPTALEGSKFISLNYIEKYYMFRAVKQCYSIIHSFIHSFIHDQILPHKIMNNMIKEGQCFNFCQHSWILQKNQLGCHFGVCSCSSATPPKKTNSTRIIALKSRLNRFYFSMMNGFGFATTDHMTIGST
jgi:hypothetical protein